ncbi:hypothetical protein N791_06665 [Lysobacter defluvii IMMIB APB-9 = DSM 18482]|uniref:Uncharacterized protein n=1 Tax=Lysobacter defluvii IMMIB APB-9 = DSM 18482 TaxID=1385515 RepID=A0A0A0M9X0_9GAMM|nr:hypothetical protein N791_06665 [Lysobacter defluvii IMMIB APB-9 = DSM 18482]
MAKIFLQFLTKLLTVLDQILCEESAEKSNIIGVRMNRVYHVRKQMVCMTSAVLQAKVAFMKLRLFSSRLSKLIN